MRHSHVWKRSRRVVLWMAGVLVVSQASLAVVVDQFAPEIRDPEYAQLEQLLMTRRAQAPDKPLAVFVGSSRVVHGFDAAQAARDEGVVLFNFGVPGSGPYFQQIILDRLQRAGIQPDILFLELLHPFYNNAGPWAMDQGLLDGARLSAGEAIGLLEYGSRSRTGPLRRWAKARLLPAYRHQAELRDSLGLGVYPLYGEPAPFDSSGYRPREIPPEDRAELTRQAHAAYDPFYPRFTLNTFAFERLTGMIRCAQSKGTRVCVVLMPEGSEFRALYTPDSEQARQSMLDRLRFEYDTTVIDARDWLGDHAFYDQHHLLPEGASEFARHFRHAVLRPMVSRPN